MTRDLPVLHYLRAIDQKLDRVAADTHDVKVRATNIEAGIAAFNRCFDRIKDRLDRIEKRLELHDPRLIMAAYPHLKSDTSMPTQLRSRTLETYTDRLKLDIRGKPYGLLRLSRGLTLGYRRCDGAGLMEHQKSVMVARYRLSALA